MARRTPSTPVVSAAAEAIAPGPADISRAVGKMWRVRKQKGVRSGQHMKPFNALLARVLTGCGIDPDTIGYEQRVPLHNSPYKLTDVIGYDPDHQLLVNIELTSQYGSYGNNRNNLGSHWSGHVESMRKSAALTDRFAYRHVVLGRVFVLADEPATRKTLTTRADKSTLWEHDDAFEGGSFVDHYGIMLTRQLGTRTYDHGAGIVTSRGYDAVWYLTSPPHSGAYKEPRAELSAAAFADDLHRRIAETRAEHRLEDASIDWMRANAHWRPRPDASRH